MLIYGTFKDAGSKPKKRQVPRSWNPYFEIGLRLINRTYHDNSFVDCCDSDE